MQVRDKLSFDVDSRNARFVLQDLLMFVNNLLIT